MAPMVKTPSVWLFHKKFPANPGSLTNGQGSPPRSIRSAATIAVGNEIVRFPPTWISPESGSMMIPPLSVSASSFSKPAAPQKNRFSQKRKTNNCFIVIGKNGFASLTVRRFEDPTRIFFANRFEPHEYDLNEARIFLVPAGQRATLGSPASGSAIR